MTKHHSTYFKLSAVKLYLHPKERYGKPTDIKKELKAFYKEVSKYSKV